jgi:WD40 repeat protein
MEARFVQEQVNPYIYLMKRWFLRQLILLIVLVNSIGFAQPYYGDTLWAKDYSSSGAFSCAFSPDGANLAIAYECMGPMVRVVNVSDGLINWESATPDLCLYNIQFSSNGQYIAVAEELGHLMVVDITIPDTIYNIDTQTGGLNSVDFSIDGNYIYTGGNDGSIRVFETATGALVHTVPAAHADAVLSINLSANGRYLVSGAKDDKVRVWDLQNNYQLIRSWMVGMDDIKCVKFTPDGSRILAGSADNNLYSLIMANGLFDTTLALHQGEINSIDISADGSFAISGSNDQTAKMINLYNYDVPFTFTNQFQTRVYGVAISPDMTKMAASNHIGYVIMYNIASLLGNSPVPINTLKIYPNPATDFLTVSGLESPTSYELIGLDGKIYQNGITSQHIDLSGLPKGLYVVHIGLQYSRIIKN